MTDQRDVLCSLTDSGEPTSEQTKARRQVTWPHNMVLNIAVTGESGAGKSSFVNAIRGLYDSDERAAPVGKEETTMEPRIYSHPTAPNVKIWDLPGVGTETFNASAYAKQMEFQNYDFFIIVSVSRLNENNIELALEMKKKKKNFCFVCSKMDIDVANTEGTEAKILQEIRDKCVKHLAKLGPPPVFLITSHDLNRFDFPKLADTLETVLPENKRGAGRAREVLDCIDNMVLNIAVTGESGVGKSSFVNAIRGLTDDENLAAKVDEIECTMKPSVYSLPTVPNVNIWDLPGMGTKIFKASSYPKEMKLQTYDFLILVGGNRLKENDIKLIEEIKKKKKNFFFVRSKIDIDVANAEKEGMTEGETLGEIRDSCVKHLAKLGPPPVFLITSRDRDRFDFPKLINIVQTVLPENKRKIVRGGELDCTDVVFNIAVTGKSGVGKSSFVNAIRGLTDTDKLAAKVGEGESTMKPTVYSHPTMPNVNIWDLPGIGTNIFPAYFYAKKMMFQNYDLFIIVSACTFSESDIKLAREIKEIEEKNILYFVLSKMDIDVAKAETGLTEEETLKETKDSCVKNLSEFRSPVFLITSHDRNRFDFPTMVNTLEKDFPENRRKIDSGREILDCLENVVLNIAVTGESGAGKSSFVNAIRGLTDSDEGAAPVGVVETTMKPTAYPHPTMPNVNIWDLPGIGTKKFDASSYVKKMNFQNYDFFIIVSATRFTENDIKLAEEIKKNKKNFYFVRTKIDTDVANGKSSKTMEHTLQKIRHSTMENLSELGDPPVFLITSHDLNRFDFPKLVETLERDLPKNKKDALLLSLPVYSLQSLEKKYNKLKKAVWALAAVSGGIGAAPVPGLSTAFDVAMAVSFFTACYHSFGLDDKSLIKLGERVNKPILPMVKESKLIQALAKNALRSTDLIAKLVLAGAVEAACILVPVAGNVVAAGVSFFTTRSVLSKGLKELYRSAKLVIEMAELQ